MAISGNNYLLKRSKQIERRKRIITYISIVSFGGSMLFTVVNTLQQAWHQPQQPAINKVENELQKQLKGYELVLQREPNNKLALEKLSLLRLRMKDRKGAIALLEKLVKLHPDRQDYKTVLTNLKNREEQEKNSK
ncbi:MAG: tetratricopeptide repeat protein [Nostoc sp. ChiSLP01]|nr:tetratricopeptide repeat protein [Nostoc sp. CmiSLP01]MDZ8284688.1 tetratricopeptide repeat protein [Nostoc sp. ChiSLP01]